MPLVGIDIVVNWNNVLRQASLQKFRAHKGKNLTKSGRSNLIAYDSDESERRYGYITRSNNHLNEIDSYTPSIPWHNGRYG